MAKTPPGDGRVARDNDVVIEMHDERERRSALIATIRKANAERLDELHVADVFSRPFERQSDRDVRLIRETEEAWAEERAQQQQQRETDTAALSRRLGALEQRIDDDRRALSQMLGEEVGDMLRDNNVDLAAEVALLRREVCALVETIIDLTTVSVAERMRNEKDNIVNLPARRTN